MFFLVDTTARIIFGWSAKCGCSHIKRIFYFLQTGDENHPIHTPIDINILPDDIYNYTTIIFTRNPYKRIISGFLDKYATGGQFRHLWKEPVLTFSQFVEKVTMQDWTIIDYHHFTPQTTEDFNKTVLLSKNIIFYDIANIDYKYIEQLYNKLLPEYIIHKTRGHERHLRITKNDHYVAYDTPVYDLNIDDYIKYDIDIKYFYNEEIQKKIFDFYVDDFTFYYENGIDYMKPIIE